MADAKDGFEFFERGVGVRFNVGRKFLGIQFAPLAPALFGGEGSRRGGGQITIDGAPPQVEAPGRFRLGPASLNKFDDPFPQIQRIGFHAPTISDYVPMSLLITIAAPGDGAHCVRIRDAAARRPYH